MLNIIVSPHLVLGHKQARTHHKRRINKKWKKRYGTVPIYDMEHTYVYKDMVIMSQGMFDLLKGSLG